MNKVDMENYKGFVRLIGNTPNQFYSPNLGHPFKMDEITILYPEFMSEQINFHANELICSVCPHRINRITGNRNCNLHSVSKSQGYGEYQKARIECIVRVDTR